MNSSINRFKTFADVKKFFGVTNDLDNINQFRQTIGYILKPMWILIFLIMIFLLIPTTLDEKNQMVISVFQSLNDPVIAWLICFGMLSVSLNTHLGSYILHQTTYKDIIKMFRKARRKGGLFTLEEESAIVNLIKEAELNSKKFKKEYAKKLKEMNETLYSKSEIAEEDLANEIKELIKENEKLKQENKVLHDLEKEMGNI